MPKSCIITIILIGLNVIKLFLGLMYVTMGTYPQDYDGGYTNSGINHAKMFDNNGHWFQCYKTLSWYNCMSLSTYSLKWLYQYWHELCQKVL
jgi:hypothetical protein